VKKKVKNIRNFFNKHLKDINTKQKIIICLITFLIVLFTCGIVFSRYAYTGLKNMYFNSKGFYFNSDKLTETTSTYQLDNWSGVDSYTIIVNMNSRKNNLIAANMNILYTINYTCPSTVICQATQASGTIPSSTNVDDFTIVVTPNANFDDGDSVTVYVETSSTSPYEKTLSANFTLNVGQMGLSYEVTDDINHPYLEIRITNTLDYYTVLTVFGNYNVNDRIDITTYRGLTSAQQANCASATITLAFNPADVLLDMTSASYLKKESQTTTTINNYQYINSFTFKIEAISSEIVKFYKTTPANNYTYPNETSTPSVITFSAVY